MVYLIENEAAVMGNRPSINLVCRRLFTSELKKWLSRQSENEIAEFLTKTELKESKNTQNMLLDG